VIFHSIPLEDPQVSLSFGQLSLTPKNWKLRMFLS